MNWPHGDQVRFNPKNLVPSLLCICWQGEITVVMYALSAEFEPEVAISSVSIRSIWMKGPPSDRDLSAYCAGRTETTQ